MDISTFLKLLPIIIFFIYKVAGLFSVLFHSNFLLFLYLVWWCLIHLSLTFWQIESYEFKGWRKIFVMNFKNFFSSLFKQVGRGNDGSGGA